MENRKYDIKALADINGWTISEFAEQSDISPQRMYDISCGRAIIKAAELFKIAKAAGVSPE